jgi:hypothetical protein
LPEFDHDEVGTVSPRLYIATTSLLVVVMDGPGMMIICMIKWKKVSPIFSIKIIDEGEQIKPLLGREKVFDGIST